MKREGNAAAVLLHIGVEPAILDFLKKAAPSAQLVSITTDQIDSLIDNPIQPCPVAVVCGKAEAAMKPSELAQVLRWQFQESGIYFATEAPSGHKKEDLLKNGFNEVFVLNIDKSSFKEAIDAALTRTGQIKAYRAVRLFDIDPSSTLDFDINVHLTLNDKYVRFCSANDKLGDERFRRLTSRNINSVHVDQADLPRFYEHAAKHLKKLGSDASLSATEKQARITNVVRKLMSDLLNQSDQEGHIGAGRAILADCRNIVKTYILRSEQGSWYKNILTTMDDAANSYTHASRVATYASLFSLGLGIGKPEELAAAGLLHDVGLAMVPQLIQDTPEAERAKEDQALYEKHVEEGLEILRSRKMILSDAILKAISQHHENFDGSGYPKKLLHNRIAKEAQILHLADVFDELTTPQAGAARLTPKEALERIKSMAGAGSAQLVFDPDLVKKLSSLFELSGAT